MYPQVFLQLPYSQSANGGSVWSLKKKEKKTFSGTLGVAVVPGHLAIQYKSYFTTTLFSVPVLIKGGRKKERNARINRWVDQRKQNGFVNI